MFLAHTLGTQPKSPSWGLHHYMFLVQRTALPQAPVGLFPCGSACWSLSWLSQGSLRSARLTVGQQEPDVPLPVLMLRPEGALRFAHRYEDHRRENRTSCLRYVDNGITNCPLRSPILCVLIFSFLSQIHITSGCSLPSVTQMRGWGIRTAFLCSTPGFHKKHKSICGEA